MAGKIVRVFLDSNVILSGLISAQGAPRVILDLLSLKLPFLAGLTGRYNILEIKRNLTKKLPAALPVYKTYLPKLGLEIIPIPTPDEVRNLTGNTSEKDIPVLASALKGRADFLLTGDKRDFRSPILKGEYPFRIVAPAEFLDVIVPGLFEEFGK